MITSCTHKRTSVVVIGEYTTKVLSSIIAIIERQEVSFRTTRSTGRGR
ncbi:MULTISPECIES: hypothetical protein [Acinetobacter]|nr:hypothetical protein [Acinetobacter sp. Z1]UTO19355.1 hypothetical protein NGC85_15860 [Acinetobacter sp. Z1]